MACEFPVAVRLCCC